MPNRTITVVIAVVIALVFAAAVVASSMGGDDAKTHTMPSGQEMDGTDMGR